MSNRVEVWKGLYGWYVWVPVIPSTFTVGPRFNTWREAYDYAYERSRG